MPCEICGSNACTRCFHSLEEQEEFDTKTGRYTPKDENKEETKGIMMIVCEICGEVQEMQHYIGANKCDGCYEIDMRLDRVNLKALTYFKERIRVLIKEKGE